jgi:hypothetical protein
MKRLLRATALCLVGFAPLGALAQSKPQAAGEPAPKPTPQQYEQQLAQKNLELAHMRQQLIRVQLDLLNAQHQLLLQAQSQVDGEASKAEADLKAKQASPERATTQKE